MKEIGDKLRHCRDGVCVLKNIDETVQKVLHENNFVAVLVNSKLKLKLAFLHIITYSMAI